MPFLCQKGNRCYTILGVSCSTGSYIVSDLAGLRLVLEEVAVSANLEVLDCSLVSHENTVLVSLEPSDRASVVYATLNSLLNCICLLCTKCEDHNLFRSEYSSDTNCHCLLRHEVDVVVEET